MKEFKKVLATVLGLTGIFLTNPGLALAVSPIPTGVDIGPQGQFAPLGNLTPASLVSGAIKFILFIAALLFFFMLVIGGIQWIISGGDKAKSEEARKKITSALVGLAIVFAAWAIAQLINTLFNVDIFRLEIPRMYPVSQ